MITTLHAFIATRDDPAIQFVHHSRTDSPRAVPIPTARSPFPLRPDDPPDRPPERLRPRVAHRHGALNNAKAGGPCLTLRHPAPPSLALPSTAAAAGRWFWRRSPGRPWWRCARRGARGKTGPAVARPAAARKPIARRRLPVRSFSCVSDVFESLGLRVGYRMFERFASHV